jgi:endonuclease-8
VPEGDTLWRTATRLRPALVGHEVVAVETPRAVGPAAVPGEEVVEVRAVGKHLLVDFSGGSTLRTHLRMTGSWHLYRPGERWRKPRHRLVARIAVTDWEAVCFSAPIVEWTTTAALARGSGPIGHLGPDLCRPESAAEEVVADCVDRMVELDPGTPIGDVLLDQRVACGVGNVYRSEVCWAERVHPWTPLSAVDVTTRARLVACAGRLLRANLGPGARTTVPGGLAVYGRRGEPCRRCGTPVDSAVGGSLGRVASWCPNCQPPPGRG